MYQSIHIGIPFFIVVCIQSCEPFRVKVYHIHMVLSTIIYETIAYRNHSQLFVIQFQYHKINMYLNETNI